MIYLFLLKFLAELRLLPLSGGWTRKSAPSANGLETIDDANALAAVLRGPKACGYPLEQVKVIHEEGATAVALCVQPPLRR